MQSVFFLLLISFQGHQHKHRSNPIIPLAGNPLEKKKRKKAVIIKVGT